MVQAAVDVLPNWQALIFLTTLVLWWAIMRPAMVRDYDNRRLPNNPTARVLFVVLCLFAYLAMVVAFHAFGGAAIKVSRGLPFFGGLTDTFQDQAPLLAAFTLGALMQLALFRDIERSLLVWLHSARHLHGDGEALARHLARSDFSPSEGEQRRNRETATRYGVYITEDLNAVGPVAFNNWRKVATLLRQLRAWNGEETRVLTQADMALLAEIETSHERKTRLAMTIVKMVDQVGERASASRPLAELMAKLSEVGHLDQDALAAIEGQMKSLLSEDLQDLAQRRVRLTLEDFDNHIRQIEDYFRIEYETLVHQAAELTAKSVILSGDAAAERLELLKHLGFTGLGRIEPINFDRILWLFLVVAFGGFLVLFLGNIGEKASPIGWDALARIAFIMTVAALIGAIVGSNRRLANAPSTPWAKYVAAGLLAAVLFVAVQLVAGLIKSYVGEPAQAGQPPFTAYRTLPWILMPFLLTVSICRLARVPAWPVIPGLGGHQHVVERLIDGLVVSAVLYLAYVMAIALHYPLEIPLSARLQASLAQPRILPIPIRWPLQALGFLIGFFVVRDVRRAAHARIVEPLQTEQPKTVGAVVKFVPAKAVRS